MRVSTAEIHQPTYLENQLNTKLSSSSSSRQPQRRLVNRDSVLIRSYRPIDTMVPYNGARTKVQLKLTIQRCKMLQEKKVSSERASTVHALPGLCTTDILLT